MGHWGWRPVSIVICICVWIVGCTDQHDEIAPTQTPTIIPEIRLLLRPTQARISNDDPALPIVATMHPSETHIVDRTELASTLIPSNLPVYITVHPPTCYESAPGGVVCYGLVENSTGLTVGRVELGAYLIDPNGVILREEQVSLDQRIVLTGGFAPYRVLFSARDSLYLSEQFGGIAVELVGVTHVQDDRAQAILTVNMLNAGWDEGRYRIRIRIQNSNADETTGARVVITLLDEQNRVTGYRIVDVDNVNDSAELEVTIDTQVKSGALQVLLYAERLNP